MIEESLKKEHLHPLAYTDPMVTLSSGRGGTPYDGLYGEAPLEKGIFFRLRVNERVGIPLLDVYGRVGKSIIWVCERAQRG